MTNTKRLLKLIELKKEIEAIDFIKSNKIDVFFNHKILIKKAIINKLPILSHFMLEKDEYSLEYSFDEILKKLPHLFADFDFILCFINNFKTPKIVEIILYHSLLNKNYEFVDYIIKNKEIDVNKLSILNIISLTIKQNKVEYFDFFVQLQEDFSELNFISLIKFLIKNKLYCFLEKLLKHNLNPTYNSDNKAFTYAERLEDVHAMKILYNNKNVFNFLKEHNIKQYDYLSVITKLDNF
jgi:hypothetical protein